MTDLEIARSVTPLPIDEVAAQLGISARHIIPYGKDKAKLPLSLIGEPRKNAKLILVTAINPTPAGEGKTTISVGLADGLRRLGYDVCAALREPSLGPVFGIKGGATGGGYSQVIPMEDINLHFTGDIHAITAANNLICALTDNAIYQGMKPHIDPRRVFISHCMDINDRQLRSIVSGLGRPIDGIPRQDHFVITAASEVMAALGLATDLDDLKHRLGSIIVGATRDGDWITAKDLDAEDAATILLKEAIMPNLVQTLEGTPVLMHSGPFANIAHGCSSVVGTKMALSHADITVTEAGFGADLGAEKFLDIKCREAGVWPAAAVLVATVRALKHHGGAAAGELLTPSVETLEKGFAHLDKHIANLRDVYGLPTVVAINEFATDSREELEVLSKHLDELGVPHALNTSFAEGSKGAEALAHAVLANMSSLAFPKRPYDHAQPLMEKVEALATKIYGADGVSWEPAALKAVQEAEAHGYGSLPICVAKTQYSFSDNPALLGVPTGFTLTVRDIKVCAGAGFVVAVCGQIMLMPGLSKAPAAISMRIDHNGVVSGLF